MSKVDEDRAEKLKLNKLEGDFDINPPYQLGEPVPPPKAFCDSISALIGRNKVHFISAKYSQTEDRIWIDGRFLDKEQSGRDPFREIEKTLNREVGSDTAFLFVEPKERSDWFRLSISRDKEVEATALLQSKSSVTPPSDFPKPSL